MTKVIVNRIITVVLTLTIVISMFVATAAAVVPTTYDSEFSKFLANDYHTSLLFGSGNESGTLQYYDVVSAGNGFGNMHYSGFNERYNYVNFSAGAPFEIVSKVGFDIRHGFMTSWEIFTNKPQTGTTEFSVGNLRFVTDYATCTLNIYYGNDLIAYYATNLTPGSYEFQSVYTVQEYTLTCVDNVIIVSRLTDGLDEKKANIIPYGNNIVWTLADGTTSEEIPVPANADFGYSQIRFKASSEIGKGAPFGNVPAGFKSGYNGNMPVFASLFLKANCGFSTLSGYVDFILGLSDNLNAEDVEYARKLYNEIQASGSAGLKIAVSGYERYITDAQNTLLETTFSDYSISATAGGSVYCGDNLFVNDKTTNPIKPGDNKTFTAVANAGYTFLHWTDGKGGIVSYESELNVNFAIATRYIAVFEKDSAAAGDDITVLFRDHAGNTIATVAAKSGNEITLPALPFAYGYTCTGWMINGTLYAAGSTVSLTDDTVVSAAFDKNNTTYSVAVVGSVDEINSKFTYNTLICAEFDKTLLKTGEVFAGWSNGTAMVSYDEKYTFFVGADVSITALISKTAEVEPLINFTNTSIQNDGKIASFLTERWLPSDCTLIESGMIYTNDIVCASKLNVNHVNGTNIRKAVAKLKTNHGQFRLNLGSRSGASTFYVAAFITYKDAGGTYKTVYTSVYSASTTAANA